MQPFIIMTDYAEVNTAVESMKLGSIDYIPKQLVEDKLVPLIRSILKERQAGQRLKIRRRHEPNRRSAHAAAVIDMSASSICPWEGMTYPITAHSGPLRPSLYGLK